MPELSVGVFTFSKKDAAKIRKQDQREKEAKERWAYAMRQLSPQERENLKVSGFIR